MENISNNTEDWFLFSEKKPKDNELIYYWFGGAKKGRYIESKDIVDGFGRLPKYWIPIPAQDNTNTSTREKANDWYNSLSDIKKHQITQKYASPYQKRNGFNDKAIEEIYLLECPTETTKDTSSGVIDGLETAIYFRYPTEHGDEYVAEAERSAFANGAQWHKEQHYNPLLELCRELKEALKTAHYAAMFDDAYSVRENHPTELIEKANNLLLNNK